MTPESCSVESLESLDSREKISDSSNSLDSMLSTESNDTSESSSQSAPQWSFSSPLSFSSLVFSYSFPLWVLIFPRFFRSLSFSSQPWALSVESVPIAATPGRYVARAKSSGARFPRPSDAFVRCTTAHRPLRRLPNSSSGCSSDLRTPSAESSPAQKRARR